MHQESNANGITYKTEAMKISTEEKSEKQEEKLEKLATKYQAGPKWRCKNPISELSTKTLNRVQVTKKDKQD